MARAAWSCLFVFAFAVAPLVAPGSREMLRPQAFVAAPVPPPPPSLPPAPRPQLAAPPLAAAPHARRPPATRVPPEVRPPSVPPASQSPSLGGMASAAISIPAAAAPAPLPARLRLSAAQLPGAVESSWIVRSSDPLAVPARPAALVPMYASFATLQALDYHSTTRALSSGAGVEANPLVRPIVDHPAGFIAVKAGATVAMVWASERMWKRHPVQAVVFMAAVNTGMAVVVAHNYSVR